MRGSRQETLMAKKGTGAGSANSKYGRNASFCKMYRDRGTRQRNKAAKVARHIRRFPADEQAQAWIAKRA